jgi:hypothetical protein
MILTWALIHMLALPACRGDGHNDHRSTSAKNHFRLLHPCPGGPDKGSHLRCSGYVIDHVCPLECCGADEPSNMQWQTEKAGKLKDKWEGDCKRSCRRKGRK